MREDYQILDGKMKKGGGKWEEVFGEMGRQITKKIKINKYNFLVILHIEDVGEEKGR